MTMITKYINGTKGLWYEQTMVRIVRGTNSQWYEKSRYRQFCEKLSEDDDDRLIILIILIIIMRIINAFSLVLMRLPNVFSPQTHAKMLRLFVNSSSVCK